MEHWSFEKHTKQRSKRCTQYSSLDGVSHERANEIQIFRGAV